MLGFPFSKTTGNSSAIPVSLESTGVYWTIQGDNGALLSLLTEHTRVDISTSVVGESIATERDVRMEGNGGGKLCFNSFNRGAFETFICCIHLISLHPFPFLPPQPPVISFKQLVKLN